MLPLNFSFLYDKPFFDNFSIVNINQSLIVQEYLGKKHSIIALFFKDNATAMQIFEENSQLKIWNRDFIRVFK
ncbi:unnamed protein product [Paramecium octaurelia]|uniref:Uncharacterized protein n=1 Tax=Paramecium octaurelia TaxID=43137 RepID=A0A8S1TZ06_PAROT|nr:unnamed protein product [Paramecium octaurelia]